MMTLTNIANNLLKAKNILIFCHNRPDGDTIGSAIALQYALKNKNINANIVCSDVIPEKYYFLEQTKNIGNTISNEKDYDVYVAVDCSAESMIGDLYYYFSRKTETYCIDHHATNTNYAKYTYVEKDSASCSEIIYKLILLLGATFDSTLANMLLLGISTDTGHFAHNNVNKNTLLTVAELVGFGGDLHNINYLMFKKQPKERAKLFTTVNDKIKTYHDGKLAIIVITKEILDKCNAKSSYTEGMIDFPLSIDTVEVAISILEVKDKSFKISFRSKGLVNVNQLANEFGGGGHVLASGCMINGYLEDVIDKLVYRTGTYL